MLHSIKIARNSFSRLYVVIIEPDKQFSVPTVFYLAEVFPARTSNTVFPKNI